MTGTEWQRLVVERDGPVARVWLARPETRNALDTTTLEELIAVFRSFETDFGARVAVLGGRGPSFSAGADRTSPPGSNRILQEPEGSARARRWWMDLGRRAVTAIADAQVVTIARIHGHAVGGGLCLALACDFRLATHDAQLSLPEVDLGLPLTWGGTARLVHEVGAARARELIMLCDAVDGRQAAEWGLVHRAVDAGDGLGPDPLDALDAAVDEWATRLAAKPEVAIHMAKSQLRALARGAGRVGDVTETDADLILGAGSSLFVR